MSGLTAKKVVKYMILPGVMPRLREMSAFGFGHAAFFMAQVFFAVRLLQPSHPYLNAANIGRFGMRHVLAQAASGLTLRKENADQVMIFIMVLAGMALLTAQLFLLGLAAFMQTANAMPQTFVDYFVTKNPDKDIAFILMDRVFGIPDLFNSCVARGAPCGTVTGSEAKIDYPNGGFPAPFHQALHGMLQVYSVGLLVVAALIFVYYIIAVAAETAQTGTPFGRRFNHVWAPLRMVVALGLLVPIAQGLNSAQWILLYAAKWGSGFATNGWIMFTDTALSGNSTLTGEKTEMVAQPNSPPVNALMEFFTVVSACKVAEEVMYMDVTNPPTRTIDAWLVSPTNMAADPRTLSGTSYQDAVDYFKKGDVHVRFGERSTEKYQQDAGGVRAFCGELKLQITDADTQTSPGSLRILQDYYTLIQELWQDVQSTSSCGGSGTWGVGRMGYCVANARLPGGSTRDDPMPTVQEMADLQKRYEARINATIQTAVQTQAQSGAWVEDLKKYGWGGAGIWYNKVAQLNGAITGAAFNLPNVVNYPMPMEESLRNRRANDSEIPPADRYRPFLSNGDMVRFQAAEDWQIAWVLYNAQKAWADGYSIRKPTNNIFIDAINLIFGTSGLFSIRENGDANIHPLAQLTAIGKGIIESTIRNLGWAAGSAGVGAVANLTNAHLVGTVAMAASGFLTQVAMIGLSIGFVLYYIIPFLPFLYFFFAVAGWIKTIFEAMVGVPLWALAHIRIDGQGLPGDAAMGGYYLILEVFLRPILIIFGMLAAITIFSAQAKLLNDTWDLVTSNLAGFDAENAPAGTGTASSGSGSGQVGSITYLRGAVDKFFFTAIYAIIVYMLGLSSFKLIDQIPNRILRWMGANASTFSDDAGDPAQGLIRNTTVAAHMITGDGSKIAGSAKGVAASAGQFIKSI